MPRRSARIVPSSSSLASPHAKRPSEATPPSARRQTKRPKTTKGSLQGEGKTRRATTTKSKYFEQAGSEDSQSALTPLTSEDENTTPSAYAESKAESYAPGSDTDDEDESPTPGSDENASDFAPDTRKKGGKLKGVKGGKGQSTGGNAAVSIQEKGGKGKELWREGVRTGLGPGKEVFIALPQARDAGDIPYEDAALHPNTMLFLKDLKNNNDREWLKKHDADFRTSQKDWQTFVEKLTEKIAEKDNTIPELPAKDLIFRIYRDVRFSNDQTPYKPHFSAAWSRTGKKGPYAAYYVHLQPGMCFIGSGLWHPEASSLALLRQEIDRNGDQLKAILSGSGIRKEIFDNAPKDEKRIVKAFVSQNQENALKTKPKGYDADNKNIELLRLRSFTVSTRLEDQDMLGLEALDRVARIIESMVPFVTYLNSVVMPDPDDDDDEDDEDDEDEDDEGDEGDDGEEISE